MIEYSIIQKSQLEGAQRLDAEYYQPEYLEVISNLSGVRTISLGSIADRITQGPNPIFAEFGLCCLNGRNINNNRVYPHDSNFVSEGEFKKYIRFRIRRNDILITLKGLGSIGKTAFVFNDYNCIFSRDVGLIRLKDEKISKFVFVFLLSKYGSSQIERSTTGGTGQLTLATSYLKSLTVPVLDDVNVIRIGDLVTVSEEKLEESTNLYSQAEDLLLEELGLKDFKAKDELTWVVDFSEVKEAQRVDAEYFQPKYKRLISKIKNQNVKPLLDVDVVENVPAKFDPKVQLEETFQYVELANIDASIGVLDGSSEILGKDAPSRAKRILQAGDVIVSSVAGSLGKVALIDKSQEGYLASTGFFQFRSQKILSEVILVLAKSMILQMQLEKQTAGTILTAVPKDRLEDIWVPVISSKTQQKIADLVRRSHEARKKSKELLEDAKRKVEEMIERGGG